MTCDEAVAVGRSVLKRVGDLFERQAVVRLEAAGCPHDTLMALLEDFRIGVEAAIEQVAVEMRREAEPLGLGGGASGPGVVGALHQELAPLTAGR